MFVLMPSPLLATELIMHSQLSCRQIYVYCTLYAWDLVKMNIVHFMWIKTISSIIQSVRLHPR